MSNYDNDALGSDALDDSVQQAIDEANADALKDAIEKVIEADGLNVKPEQLNNIADNIAKTPEATIKIVDEEEPFSIKEPNISEGKGQGFHVTDHGSFTSEFRGMIPGPMAKISKREKLTAQKEGIEEFIQKETEITENKERDEEQYGRHFSDSDQFFHQHNIQMAKDKINEIEEELKDEPEDTPTKIDESASDCAQEHQRMLQTNKKLELKRMREFCAHGINDKGKWGMDAIRETPNEQRKMIKEALFRSLQAFGE